ncbi:MAG: lamin tail domain-containing protein, partial [Minicystis sp.]
MRSERLVMLMVLLGNGLACGGSDTHPASGSTAGSTSGSTGGSTGVSTTASAGGADAGPDGGAGGAGGGAPQQALCAGKSLKTWSRKSLAVGGVVSFNEIMYHPAGDPKLEWIELYNTLGIEVDLSGFRLDGAVSYIFPTGTFVGAHGFVVVAADAALLAQSSGVAAIGSYTGLLPNDAGKVELWNNAGRLLDLLAYSDVDPWPVIPDGSGASLAKRSAASDSTAAERWSASALVGGTPGAANFADLSASLPPLTLVAPGATWRYRAMGAAPAADWSSIAYDDSNWPAAPATFFASDAPGGSVPVTATFTADNFFALYVGKADGSGLSFVGRDAVGDWTSPESFPFQAGPDDYFYVAAWEAPGDNGGPQSLIGEIALPGGGLLGTSPASFEWVLGPQNGSPGGGLNDPPPTPAAIQGLIQAANGGQSWAAPLASADKSAGPWGPAVGGAFSAGTQFVWPDSFGDVSVTNTANTFVLFRSKAPLVPPKGATKLDLGPTTSYFRTKFQVPASVELVQPWLDALIDDGAVFYLNGVEIFRLRMPNGAIGPATLASSTVVDAVLSAGTLLAASALLPGENVLAVEVHQAMVNDPDLTFGASLLSSVNSKTPGGVPAGLAFNEVAGASAKAFWVEIANLGQTFPDVGGYVITTSKGEEHTLPPQLLAPGALLVLDQAALGFGADAGAKLFLYTPDRTAVVDGVEVDSVPRGRSAKAGGELRYPDLATPGAPNVFVEHEEVVINEIMFRPPPESAADGSLVKATLEWVELHNRGQKPVDLKGFQLVDAIEYTIPEGAVIPPGGYLVVTRDLSAMKAAYPALANAGNDKLVGNFKGTLADAGENLVLRDACGNPVDAVHYHGDGQWPERASGGGSSLELRDPRADNGVAEAWAASDEASAAQWQTITYQGVAQPSSVGPDGFYQELVLGLLDAGAVLIDDVSVIEDPAGAATQLVQNGSFESGTAASWRLLGNHRHSEVVVDPADAGNHVLRLVATGATEHMHNHLETTLAAGHPITNGKSYQISYRARWEGGSNLLNSRLYFDRLAKTTTITFPPTHGTPGAPNSRAEKNVGPTYRKLHHAPAVPKPSQPVLVSVTAEDPDGIDKLVVWYSVDGNPAQSLPMASEGKGRYSALVPGGAAGSVVQFYVTGVDATGVSSSFPAAGPGSRALWKVDDGLASKQGLHNLRVVMTPADVTWLFESKNLMSNDLLGSTIIDDEGEVYYDVGLRLKSSERGRPEAVRVGFALRFQPDQPFRGVYGDLMIDRSEGVGFGQRELFFNQAMNHAGTVVSQYDDLVKVLTPRPEHVGPAQLQLARFGDLLLDNQFASGGDGPVFEYELIYFPLTTDDGTPQGNKLPQPDSVIGVGIHDLGDDEEAYRFPFILKNNRWQDDYRGLIHFAKVFGTGGAEFNAKVGEVVDVDQWLRSFAFATLSGVVDNYGVGDAHNGNFYVRPEDGRVLYFPHDLDFYGGSPQAPLVSSGDL